MKMHILVAAMLMAGGVAIAQTETMKDGVMMKDGKMMAVKDGKATPMTKEMTMADGTKVMVNGSVVKKDGTKVMMKDGDAMDSSGMMKK